MKMEQYLEFTQNRDILSVIFGWFILDESNFPKYHRNFYSAVLVCRCWQDVLMSIVAKSPKKTVIFDKDPHSVYDVDDMLSKMFWRKTFYFNEKIQSSTTIEKLDFVSIKGRDRIIELIIDLLE